MEHSRVCADCGIRLGRRKYPLCHDCKRRLISDVNTPGMDKAISLLFTAVVIGAIIWLVF